jgi:carbohydrate kinase (thermoresistant glucokinase family)
VSHATAPAAAAPLHVVVMGVSGCGKSSIGQGLAQALGLGFIEGDRLHPPANVAKMAAGTPLNDDDRAGWLAAIGARLAQAHAERQGLVVACSALKRRYRDGLRSACPGLRFLHLHGAADLLRQRMRARTGHYMPPSLLDSQLATLEPPAPDEHAVTLDIAPPRDAVLQAALAWLQPPGDRSRADNHAMSQTAAPLATFTQVVLFTDTDGRARFREQAIALTEGKPQAMLSPLMPSGGLQLRHSPVGFRSDFHCTGDPQWVFILRGQMEIGLQDGSSRVFGPGEHFFSADTLPPGASFDPAVHGHWSRQVGPDPLVTAFVRA